MTTAYHTPIAVGAPATSAVLEVPLGQLDAGIAGVVAAGSATSTTLTAQATAGQKNMVVAARDGFVVGDVFFIGTPNGTYESGSIASGTGAGAGTLVAVANLANTYAIGTPVSKSPVELVQARGTYPTVGARLAALSQFLWAKDYGVKADGTTDDTAACQAALDALIGSSAKGVMFPAGTIRITAALEIGTTAYQYKSILGAGWGITVFRQDTSNIAVFKVRTTDVHSIEFGEMTLTYLNVQTSANTGAIALNFTNTGPTSSWYWWHVHRLEITKAHIGIGVGGAGSSGSLTLWNSTFDQIKMAQISMSMIMMRSPAAAGMPINTFRDILHIGNGGVAPAGTAIDLGAVEAVFVGVDIEDWYNRLIFVNGGSPVTVIGLHTERHILNTTSAMIEVSDNPLAIHGAVLDWAVQGGVAAKLFTAGVGSSLSARDVQLSCTLTSGTITGLTSGVTTRAVEIDTIIDYNDNVPFGLGYDIDYVGPFNPVYCNSLLAGVANEAYLYAFTVKRAVRVGRARIEVGAGAGNIDVGIYDAGGTRLASTGSTAMVAGPASQQIALTASVMLLPGRRYYAALAMNGAVATLQGFSLGVSNTAGALGVATKVAASFPLPATIVIGTTAPIRVYPICFEP